MRALFLSVFLGEGDIKPNNFLHASNGKNMRIDFAHSFVRFDELGPLLADPVALAQKVNGAERLTQYVASHVQEAHIALRDAVLEVVAAIVVRPATPVLLQRFEGHVDRETLERTAQDLERQEAQLLSLPQVRAWLSAAQ
jgi:hypothetical protein